MLLVIPTQALVNLADARRPTSPARQPAAGRRQGWTRQEELIAWRTVINSGRRRPARPCATCMGARDRGRPLAGRPVAVLRSPPGSASGRRNGVRRIGSWCSGGERATSSASCRPGPALLPPLGGEASSRSFCCGAGAAGTVVLGVTLLCSPVWCGQRQHDSGLRDRFLPAS